MKINSAQKTRHRDSSTYTKVCEDNGLEFILIIIVYSLKLCKHKLSNVKIDYWDVLCSLYIVICVIFYNYHYFLQFQYDVLFI